MKAKFRLTAFLAVGAAMLGGGILSTMSPAEAEAGRRFCVYSQDYGIVVNGTQYRGWAAVDYKKDGACPTVDPKKFEDRTGLRLTDSQPVSKVTCEDLWVLMGGTFWDGDMCLTADNDALYRFLVYKSTEGNYATVAKENLGNVSNFAP